MEKIKKDYSLKIIIIVISILFFTNTSLYSNITSENSLRPPLGKTINLIEQKLIQEDIQRPARTSHSDDSFDYVRQQVRKFMPFVDIEAETLPGENLQVEPRYLNSEILSYVTPYSDEASPESIIRISRNFARAIKSAVSSPRVYYIGLGYNNQPGSRFDIIFPLLKTDFTELIGVEKENVSYETFKELVRNQLNGIIDNDTEITFPPVDEKNPNVYIARFRYMGIDRILKAYFGFDGTKNYPRELKENGYNVLLNEVFIENIKLYEELIALLDDNAGFIIAEGSDLTTADPKKYQDEEEYAYINLVFLVWLISKESSPYLLTNFSEVSSRPFFAFGKKTYWNKRQGELGFPQKRPVLLSKNSTVSLLTQRERVKQIIKNAAGNKTCL